MKGLGRVMLLGAVALGLSGCALMLVSAGAAGGYAVSRDSIKNYFDMPVSQVYRASREVIGEMGLVTMEDQRRGRIKATVLGDEVTVTVTPISEKTVELKVKARKNFLIPAIDTAQAVHNKIRERL